MKKTVPLFFLILFLLLVSLPAQAQLVPCGGEGQPECTICHLFLMLNNIIGFIMFKLVPPVAIVMLIVGGIMYFFAGVSPHILTQAKSIITSVVIGLTIVFCAWIIVNTILVQSGIVKAESVLKWYEISCEVK